MPLRSDAIDPEAEPGPKPVTKMLGAEAMRVKLFTPDTGPQVTLTFRRAACRILYRIEDDSL